MDEASLLQARRAAAELQQHRRRVERRLLRLQADIEHASRCGARATALGVNARPTRG
jgi:hypothetical protein